MEEITFQIASQQQTRLFGEELGKISLPGDTICLDGDLGAGKTTLSQSIALGLEVSPDIYVTSPSFAIFHEYPARLPIYHMDFYRLGDYTEVEDLGFDEYFYGRGVCLLEWALRAEEILPQDRLHLFIEITGESGRSVTCRFDPARWKERLVEALKKCGCTPGKSN